MAKRKLDASIMPDVIVYVFRGLTCPKLNKSDAQSRLNNNHTSHLCRKQFSHVKEVQCAGLRPNQ